MWKGLPWVLALSPACAQMESGALQSGSAETLMRAPARFGGCGDTLMWAGGAADIWKLEVSASGMAQEAAASGVPVERVVQLPSNDVFVSGVTGTAVSSATCVGNYPYPGPQVDNAYSAVSGEVKIRVTPDGSATPYSPMGIGEVRLRDVVLEDAAGAQIQVGRLVWTASVGLYPP